MKQLKLPAAETSKVTEIQRFLEFEFIDANSTNGWIASHHNLRYIPNISTRARLILLDIITLSKRDGFCWAPNSYFMEKYNVSKITISRAMTELVKEGFINREVDVAGHNAFRRKLFLNVEKLKELVTREDASDASNGIIKSDYIIKNDMGYNQECSNNKINNNILEDNTVLSKANINNGIIKSDNTEYDETDEHYYNEPEFENN